MTHAESPCYHCGLPIPEGEDWHLAVDGKERAFCCPGCREVCRAIVDAGLGDYYRMREGDQARSGREAVPEVLRHLALYDHPEIQKSFVIGSGETREAELMLEDIRCPACLWLNERRLRQLEGVVEVEIDYVSHRARVAWDPERIKLSQILQAIAAIGYVAHPYDPTERRRLLAEQRKRDGSRLLFAGITGMPVMNLALATYIMGGPDAGGQLPLWEVVGRWSALLAAVGILGYAAQDFFLGAWRDLKARRIGMDVPIVIGLLTAFVGSLVATIQQTGEVYYDSIAMFVFFVLTARFLEKKGRIKAADALDRLARVVPRTARRVAGDGSEAIVPVVDLVPGDRVRLLPGESVPADGRLLEGASGFDEALLTGESLPVARRPGDTLRGGSLNVEQPCVMEVTGTGGQSALGNILRLVQRAQRDRPRVALLAERAAAWFVGVVLGIGAATALAWWLIDPAQALHNTVAVLIVTCPCALALATPAALVIAAGRFVHIGSLAVRMNAVESLARTQMLVFDKTGTLTRGRFRLEAVEPLAGQGRERVLAVAAALEAGSEHPLAAPFRPFDAGLAVSARRNHPGEGLSGVLDGVEWRLGKPEHAWPSPDRALAARIAALREGGQVVLMLADAQAPSALFLLSDTPRPGARELVERLHGRGIATAILSGDHPSHVRRLAREVGIDEAHGDLLPADKLAWVSERRRRGTRIAMVGDGINDAPTLAAADCAIALSGGTELAQTTSDYILLRDDLRAIAATHHLARRTRRVVLQNLLWAAGYNLLAIPAAALGYIPPWGAAIGMSISSLLVIGNALRLSRVHKAERLTKEGPEDEEPVPLPARLGAA